MYPEANSEALNVNTLAYGEDNNTVIVIDDFFPDTTSLITQTQSGSPFYEQPTDFYPGKRKIVEGEYAHFAKNQAEPLIHQHFSPHEKRTLEVTLCAFSITTTPEKKLRPIQCIPHIDNHDSTQFAVVHYLCNEQFGGTSFYRHKSTGYESINQDRLQAYFALLKQEVMKEERTASYIDGDTALFKRVLQVALKFNRAVIYPANVLHSGDIKPVLGLSDDPLEGRLTINTFLNFSG